MERTVKQEIETIVKRFCENDVAVKNITDGVYNLLYDMPSDQVVIAKNRFQKMRAPFGDFFRFYNEDGTWTKWQFVRRVRNG